MDTIDSELIERIEGRMIGTQLSVEGAALELGVLLDTLSLRQIAAAIDERGNLIKCAACGIGSVDVDGNTCDDCIDAELQDIDDEIEDLESQVRDLGKEIDDLKRKKRKLKADRKK